MASLYAEYLAERAEVSIIESEVGFATYEFIGTDSCLIKDIYVRPEVRKLHVAAKMADEIAAIARREGCTKLLGTVCPAARGATASIQVLLSYGFRLQSSRDNFIIFEKDL